MDISGPAQTTARSNESQKSDSPKIRTPPQPEAAGSPRSEKMHFIYRGVTLGGERKNALYICFGLLYIGRSALYIRFYFTL